MATRIHQPSKEYQRSRRSGIIECAWVCVTVLQFPHINPSIEESSPTTSPERKKLVHTW